MIGGTLDFSPSSFSEKVLRRIHGAGNLVHDRLVQATFGLQFGADPVHFPQQHFT